jgi:hypothetical protein
MRLVDAEQLSSIKYDPMWIKTIQQGSTFIVEEHYKGNIQYEMFASISKPDDVLDRSLLQFTCGNWKCLDCPRTEGCVHLRQWDKVCKTENGSQCYIDSSFFGESAGTLLYYRKYLTFQ